MSARLKPAAPRFQVKHYTTEPLRSLLKSSFPALQADFNSKICSRKSSIDNTFSNLYKLCKTEDEPSDMMPDYTIKSLWKKVLTQTIWHDGLQ